VRITPSEDTEELRGVVRGFLSRHGDPVTVLRGLDDGGGWDPALWARLATQIGLAALDVPEERGGAGAGFREVAVVAEELGRSLLPTPWFGTAVLAVGALTLARGRDDLLAGLASGDRTGTVAHLEAPHRWGAETVTTTATRDDAHWRLRGTKTLVVDGTTADLLLVSARTDTGVGLFAVDASADGLTRTPMRVLDPTRPLAAVELDAVPADPVCADAAGVLDALRVRALAALASEQTGGAAACLDAAAGYAGSRIQFGRPIGTFQAIKHRCADMAVRVEEARSAAWWAAATLAEADPDAAPAADTAALVCSEAYTWVAEENVQVHGGIGFTWEHPAHLHVRRALSSAVLFGDAAGHRDRLLAALDVR
jgi:alkylation response protein AidB-like acyl-CoA dehydrogenase